MIERDALYLKHILDCIVDIEEFVIGYTEETFVNDKKTFNASIRMFEVIGEVAKKLSDEFKSKYPHIEWRKIAGMRDVLIHNYEGVDLDAVWQIIKNKIPELKIQIQAIINKL